MSLYIDNSGARSNPLRIIEVWLHNGFLIKIVLPLRIQTFWCNYGEYPSDHLKMLDIFNKTYIFCVNIVHYYILCKVFTWKINF